MKRVVETKDILTSNSLKATVASALSRRLNYLKFPRSHYFLFIFSLPLFISVSLICVLKDVKCFSIIVKLSMLISRVSTIVDI